MSVKEMRPGLGMAVHLFSSQFERLRQENQGLQASLGNSVSSELT